MKVFSLIKQMYVLILLPLSVYTNDVERKQELNKNEKIIEIYGSMEFQEAFEDASAFIGKGQNNELLLFKNFEINHPIYFENVTVNGSPITRSGVKSEKACLETTGLGAIKFGPNAGLKDCLMKNSNPKP